MSAAAYQCFACQRVTPLVTDNDRAKAEQGECPSCGAGRGRTLSAERFRQGFAAGAIYNIDPKTGAPAKGPPPEPVCDLCRNSRVFNGKPCPACEGKGMRVPD
jgi:hypothetical protein